jgi:histidinol-phosphate aminotransferase
MHPPIRFDPCTCGRKGISEIAAYVPGKPIQEVKEEFGLAEVIKLASNECPLPLSENVIHALQAEFKNISRYPDGNCRKLRRKVAQKTGLPESCFLFGNGAEESVMLIGQALLNSDENSLVPSPIYDAYETSIKIAGASVVKVPLDNYRIDLNETLLRVNERTKIIWLCSPVNPTGTFIKRDEFDRFLSELPDNIAVVLDEAYLEYAQAEDAAHTMDYLFKDDRVIGLRTFSKAYGLAGLRVGYIVAHPGVISMISMIKLPFNVNVLAQAAALAALDNDDFMHSHVKMIVEERTFLAAALSDRNMEVVPSESNFLFVKTPIKSLRLFNELLPMGIIIRPGSIWNMPYYIRLTVGTHEQNQRFLASLDQCLENQAA